MLSGFISHLHYRHTFTRLKYFIAFYPACATLPVEA